jgi:hypothetical protein
LWGGGSCGQAAEGQPAVDDPLTEHTETIVIDPYKSFRVEAGRSIGSAIAIRVYPDALEEPAEDFSVSLTDVSGATVAQRQAIGTIFDDDRAVHGLQWYSAHPLRDDSDVVHFRRAVAYSRAPDMDGEALADPNRDRAVPRFRVGLLQPRDRAAAAGASDRRASRLEPGHRPGPARAACLTAGPEEGPEKGDTMWSAAGCVFKWRTGSRR